MLKFSRLLVVRKPYVQNVISKRSIFSSSVFDDANAKKEQKQKKMAAGIAVLAATAASFSQFSTVTQAFSSSPCGHDEGDKKNAADVVLYQYEPCPYCNKVRAVLDYLYIPYEVVEVNPLTKKETKNITDYKKVPVAKIKGEIFTDSSKIIAELHKQILADSIKHIGSNPLSGSSGLSEEDEAKWTEWIDKQLIILMPPNIYRTVPESLQSFQYLLTEGNFTPMERRLAKYAGAFLMYFITKLILNKRHGVTDPRESLYSATEAWLSAVGEEQFLGGIEPNLIDVSVFGVYKSVVGLDTFDDLMENTKLKNWYDAMEAKIGATKRINQ